MAGSTIVRLFALFGSPIIRLSGAVGGSDAGE